MRSLKTLFFTYFGCTLYDKKRNFWNNSNIFSLNFDSSNTQKILPEKDQCPKILIRY